MLLRAIEKFQEHIERCHSRLSAETGHAELRPRQFHCLEVISQHENVTCGRLAELLSVTRPSVTEIVLQLEKCRCIQRQRCSRDGRRCYIVLTERGRNIARIKLLNQQRLVQKIKESLTDAEIDALAVLLNKIQ